MTTKQLELIDYLTNNCFPNTINQYFANHQILNYKKIEIENYHFNYYIIELETYLKSYAENIIDNAESYFKELYLNKFSFETLIQDVISKKNKYKLLYPFLKRNCFIIKYSKKYNSFSCTETFESINFIKTSHNHNRSILKKSFKATKSWNVNTFVFSKKERKLFNINKNNKVLMYFGRNKNPKYISIKNANTFIKHNPVYKELIQKLFNIHLNNNMIIPEETTFFIKNTFLYNKNNFVDILRDINSKIVTTTMIDKFTPDDIINVITMLKKEDIDKFIFFYDDYYDIFENLNKQTIISSNSLLSFLCFYVLKSKNLIEHDNKNIYYSNLHKPFIVDVISYINENFQKEIIVDLSFNFHNELKYIKYKNTLKSMLQLKNDTISFASIFNQLNIDPQFKVVYIDNKLKLYKIFIKENIFIDLNRDLLSERIWFQSFFEDKVILFSLVNEKGIYFFDNLTVSNNQIVNMENFKIKISHVLTKINISFYIETEVEKSNIKIPETYNEFF